jgi:DNA-binding NarL/FixJ family response regulator
MEKIRIIIFAKQDSTRNKLRMLLKEEPDFEIIGEVRAGIEMHNYVVTRLFDILIFNLTAVEELDILRTENRYGPGIKTVIIYDDNNLTCNNEMLRSGAKAYVSNESVTAELAVAVREAMIGKVHLSYPLYEHAIETYIKQEPSPTNASFGLLTKRESEVFNMVVKGLTSTKIGAALCISRRTVEIHRANILRKLNIKSQYEQIKNYAIGLGIFEPENRNFANNNVS